jgi:hypothetical protein
LVNGAVTEFLDKPFDDGPVGSHRIFFGMGVVMIDPDFCCFGKFHGIPPWVKRFMVCAAPKVNRMISTC